MMAAALFFTALPGPALAAGPFDDARQSLVGGDPDSALLTIDTGAIAVNASDDNGYTLLHYAAKVGSPKAVQGLLNRGADPKLKALDGKTPLDLAANAEVRAMLTPAP